MATLSGQVTITTPGTAVQVPDDAGARMLALKAHPDNGGTIWVGQVSGDVSNGNGYPLDPGEQVPIDLESFASHGAGDFEASEIWVDADSAGDKLCWFVMGK